MGNFTNCCGNFIKIDGTNNYTHLNNVSLYFPNDNFWVSYDDNFTGKLISENKILQGVPYFGKNAPIC